MIVANEIFNFLKWKTLKNIFLSCGLEGKNMFSESLGLVSTGFGSVFYAACFSCFMDYSQSPSGKVDYLVYNGEKKRGSETLKHKQKICPIY